MAGLAARIQNRLRIARAGVAERWVLRMRDTKSFDCPSLPEFLGHSDPSPYISVGERCRVERDVTIWLSDYAGAEPKLTLGREVYVGRNTFLGAYQPITIGDYCQIGAYCYIISANHAYERRDIPISKQGFTGKPVVIGEDAWLGTHVVVLPGVTIGKGAIVAAGSVVTKDIPDYEIWGGVPAKFLDNRP